MIRGVMGGLESADTYSIVHLECGECLVKTCHNPGLTPSVRATLLIKRIGKG
jgi:hypothetical protein